MTFADLAMVNLHQRADGRWSYAAFVRPHQMWISNYGLDDPMECWDEIMREMLSHETQLRIDRARIVSEERNSARRARRASGGNKDRNAGSKRRERGKSFTGQASEPRPTEKRPTQATGQRRASGRG